MSEPTLTLDDLPTPDFEGRVPVDELHVDGDNPNEQSDEMFGLLCNRLRKNGWLGGPIITDMDGLIADGEHRWRAAQEIGLKEVPVRRFEIDDATRRLWRQELNKIRGEHDTKRDALEYDLLVDRGKTDEVLELTKAADEDLDELLASIRMESDLPVEYDYNTDHNVYFEDCVEGMQARLTDDSVECVIADPPYGVSLNLPDGQNATKDRIRTETVDNDDLQEALTLFDDALDEIERVLTDTGLLYVFASWKTYGDFVDLLRKHGFIVYNCLVWVKTDTTPFPGYLGRYQFKHEFIIFAGRENARRINGSHADVFEYREARFADVPDQLTQHPTQKPVDLLAELARHATNEGDTILDPFMGSGSTAVAAIETGRDYVGFELDADNYQSTVERRIKEAHRRREATVNADAKAEAND